jgi:putative sterol carrier protein
MAKSASSKTSPAEGLPSAATAFFTALADQGSQPLLHGESGTLRFDLSGGSRTERWYVVVTDGDIAVSHRGGHADTVLRMDEKLFDEITRGTANAMASQLRGAINVEGDLHLLLVFQRLFPGPPSSTGRRPAIEGSTVTKANRR